MTDDELAPGDAQQDVATPAGQGMRDLVDAGAVFLWVHAGDDQPREIVALLEAVRSLGRSAPAWCARLAKEADRALDELAAEPNPRYEPVVDPSGLYAVAAVLRRAAERIAAAADVLVPVRLDRRTMTNDERMETARAVASGLSVLLDLLRESLATRSVTPRDLGRIACSLEALAASLARRGDQR